VKKRKFFKLGEASPNKRPSASGWKSSKHGMNKLATQKLQLQKSPRPTAFSTIALPAPPTPRICWL
jgi:hypothetical protein